MLLDRMYRGQSLYFRDFRNLSLHDCRSARDRGCPKPREGHGTPSQCPHPALRAAGRNRVRHQHETP